MAYLRWLHKSWNVIWTFIGVLVLSITLLAVAAFGVMQLQTVKDRIAIELENRFSQDFEGVLTIGHLDGLMPIQMQLQDVRIYPDSLEHRPVLQTNSITIGLDVWSLLQNRIVIKALQIENVDGILDPESDFSIDKAFVRKTIPQNTSGRSPVQPNVQIIIPSVSIENGNLLYRNALPAENRYSSGDSLHLNNIQLDVFFEYSNNQRFVDIDLLQFEIPELDIPPVSVYGQIYNDERYLELNALNINMGKTALRIGAEADGVNLLLGEVGHQFSEAELSFNVDRMEVEPSHLSYFVPDIPVLPASVKGSVRGEGKLDALQFTNVEISLSESYAQLYGTLNNIQNPSQLYYNASLDALILSEQELDYLIPGITQAQKKALSATRVEGNVSGTTDTTLANLHTFNAERGTLDMQARVNWEQNNAFEAQFQTDSLDLGYLFHPKIQSTRLTLTGEIKSSAADLRNSKGGLVINGGSGVVDNRTYSRLSILVNWENGIFNPSLSTEVGESILNTTGRIDLQGKVPSYQLEGDAKHIFVNDLIQNEQLKKVFADFEFDVDAEGNNWDNLNGQLSLDVIKAIAGEDTLDRHQIYMDLNKPDEPKRILRLTSTAFDVTLTGNFNPSNVGVLGRQWKNYFTERMQQELFFESVQPDLTGTDIVENQSIELTGRLKNMALIRSYLPEFPAILSGAKINSTLNINSHRLLFNSTLVDSRTKINRFEADSLMLQVTGSFRRESKLKDFAGIQFEGYAADVDYGFLKGKNASLSVNLNRDSLQISSSIPQLAEKARFELEAAAKISPNALTLYIHDFNVGSEGYSWTNRATPLIRYQANDKLLLQDFIFESDSQFVEINGTFSNATEDSVNYRLEDVQLSRLSELIAGRISFGGILNGTFTTRTLTKVPTIQGDIEVEALNLDETLVGDITINSRYNDEQKRFNTTIISTTDSTKYPDYFADSGRKGQQFEIDGYVLAPKGGDFPEADSLFKFDVDFENIDMWILPLIGPKVFAQGGGRAKGSGIIWGNLDTYDFESTFDVGESEPAFIRPNFLDTYYYAQGNLTFTRHEGLSFNDIYLIDPSGGSAILGGWYDLNDFADVDSMYITLDMDEFQFLNSSFDPTAAFFGKAYGSSVVSISGSNLNPVLRTEQPVVISDFSEISIPLLEETELDEGNRFIRFVDTFDIDEITGSSGNRNIREQLTGDGELQEDELTFAERFTLDLQFVAYNPMTVRLIFDPVTGDIITANGTGRIRILLEDEQVSMFGRFDITDGRYQFVSGDIFTRRFELEPGGTIIWQGDPANARLNLNAIYSARPDINTLSTGGARDPENAQRVPVDLVLNVNGTISSIENNFYFQLPKTYQSQQSSTLATQLASINRDENLKLIQAANFMLMGDFIPVSSAGTSQNALLSENISGSAAVLNPLLSSQVINPLLSNQVNSLLNSDLSSLDVDFNLNTYNQIDLGVALRLYNDKLILRREGQITGRQSNIGDLGATYQINQTFALTAFHRQDLTFGTLNSTEQSQQSQDINGVGVEAKVSFNTWQQFFDRLFSPFRKLFGSTDKKKNQEEITEI